MVVGKSSCLKSWENCFTALYSFVAVSVIERYLETSQSRFSLVACTKLGTSDTIFYSKSWRCLLALFCSMFLGSCSKSSFSKGHWKTVFLCSILFLLLVFLELSITLRFRADNILSRCTHILYGGPHGPKGCSHHLSGAHHLGPHGPMRLGKKGGIPLLVGLGVGPPPFRKGPKEES